MRDGHHVYYQVQWRRVAESPWLKPKEPLEPLKEPWSWRACQEAEMDPWHPKVHGEKLYKAASDDKHGVWARTGDQGWTRKSWALAAYRRALAADKAGKYCSKDTYGTVECTARHEFRVVRITCTKKTTVEILTQEAPVITRVSSHLHPPAWGLLRRNNRWEEVQITDFIQERGGNLNAVVCPDGTKLEVKHELLRFDGRIKRFTPHPEHVP